MFRRLAAVVAVLGALVAPGAVMAADSLGATVQSRVYLAESRELWVQNDSTVPVAFSLEPEGSLSATPASLTLEPEALDHFTLSGEADEDGTAVTVQLHQLGEPTPGQEQTGLTFTAHVYMQRPADWSAVVAGAVLALLLLATLVTVLWRRRRRRLRWAMP